jgi:tRNA U34 2-thiouridine synthase MnmA/TrmU
MMEKDTVIKAVALLSGGLDSQLAVRIVQEQGIEVHAFNYVSCFSENTSLRRRREAHPGRRAAQQLGVPLKVTHVSKKLLEIVKNPRHGYGKNMNPCVDCRILTLTMAKEYMKEIRASFLITGEVLGQRPMSQRRDAMRLIDSEAGVVGLVLRPLSAKHLAMTVPEREGWVDREKLLAIQGRSRKEQLRLAELYGIREYTTPAGGCLLTSEGFARKVRDLIAHKNADINDVLLLKVGRHFRLPHGGKAVVGRDKEENLLILRLARKGDVIFRPRGDLPAPTALLRDSRFPAEADRASGAGGTSGRSSGIVGGEAKAAREEIAITADLCVSHSKLRTEASVPFEYYRCEEPSEIEVVQARAMPREEIDSLRI